MELMLRDAVQDLVEAMADPAPAASLAAYLEMLEENPPGWEEGFEQFQEAQQPAFEAITRFTQAVSGVYELLYSGQPCDPDDEVIYRTLEDGAVADELGDAMIAHYQSWQELSRTIQRHAESFVEEPELLQTRVRGFAHAHMRLAAAVEYFERSLLGEEHELPAIPEANEISILHIRVEGKVPRGKGSWLSDQMQAHLPQLGIVASVQVQRGLRRDQVAIDLRGAHEAVRSAESWLFGLLDQIGVEREEA